MKTILPLVASLLVAATSRADTDCTFTYQLIGDDAAVEITGYRVRTTGKVVIPGKIAGKPVTRIGELAFGTCHGLTSVTIPDSVTSIGKSAFASCFDLKSVTIPDSVTSIGEEAFSRCGELTSVTIPDSVTSIGKRAFDSCSGLTDISVDTANPSYSSVDGVLYNKLKSSLVLCPPGKAGAYTIPDSVTSIGEDAFSRCSELTSVTIPDSVTSFGEMAFVWCRGLKSVTIPDSVTSIGEWAFFACSGLTDILVDTANPSYSSVDGVLYNKLKTSLVLCPEGKAGTYAIPDSVTNIGEGAFSDCTGLTRVTIPDSVTSIGDGAFSGCSGLTSVTIPDRVTSIGEAAFCDCDGLTSVTIPNRVTSIGDGAFYDCDGLTVVVFLGDAPKVGKDCFDGSVSGFSVFYLSGSVGFTSPKWLGYPAQVRESK